MQLNKRTQPSIWQYASIKNKPPAQALVEFAEQVEQIKEEQRKRQLQLEQPSETKQRSPQ